MNNQYKLACETCAGNQHLFEAARTRTLSQCSYCKAPVKSFAFVAKMASVVAQRLEALMDTSTPTRPTHRRPRPVSEVIRENLKGSNAHLIEDLIAAVASAKVSIPLVATNEYLWISDREDHDAENHEWAQFQTKLRSGSRFFNESARDFLDELFGILSKLSIRGLVSDIKPAATLVPGRRLFRARRANSHEELQPIVGDLARELHAPPPGRTPANRMNVERSPAFYAALDVDTAVAETRPSIGSRVVVGEFKTTRSLKVVDFTVLPRSSGALFSIWDADFRRRAVMRGLLRKLQERIARPIPLGAEHEYLETQLVADYLFSRGGFEAVLFESSQNKGGTNVVILSGALGAYKPDSKAFSEAPLEYVEGSAKLFVVEEMNIRKGWKNDLLS